MKPLAIAACLMLPVPLFAQSQIIPEPVITQCNETATAASLPTCLREGAVAFEMLELARSEAFYGPAADRVIEICGERNDTFGSQWTCFSVAVERASETRALIGLDNIADACVAGISDAQRAERIEEAYLQSRERMFPDVRYFGGESYFPFNGCPAAAEKDESGSPKPADDVADALASALGAQQDDDRYSDKACRVYAEIEGIISTTDAEILRSMTAQMKEIDEDNAEELAAVTGISEDAAVFIYGSGENQLMTAALIMGAFVETHHPALIEEFLADEAEASKKPGAELGAEMAQSIFASMLASARQEYEDNCGPANE